MSEKDELDFERADFGESAGDPSNSAGESLQTLGCSVCGLPMSDAYYTRDDAFVCPSCEGPTRAAGPPGSAFSRMSGAVAAGLIASVVASALWMIVTELTGWEIGLIAIAVGWIVGIAVAMGSRGVGGLPYQFLAVFLTYTAIVMTYVPMLLHEFEGGFDQADAETEIHQGIEDGESTAASAASEEASEEAKVFATRATQWIFAIAIAFAVPFLSGFENIIGILIIGFGLYQAWTMTAKREVVWAGPFQIGAGPAALPPSE